MTQNRVPAGVHTGGQYAHSPRPESDATLSPVPEGVRTATSFDVTAANGVPFRCSFVPGGGSYGATGSLVADKDMVEFYDTRYPHPDRPGQFVSRYYAETLLDGNQRGVGLNLDGGEPSWQVDGKSMDRVRAWAAEARDVHAPSPAGTTRTPVTGLRVGDMIRFDDHSTATISSLDGGHKDVSIEFDGDESTIATYTLDEQLDVVTTTDTAQAVEPGRDSVGADGPGAA